MTVPSGFPAPGPQGREPLPDRSYGPPPTGPGMQSQNPMLTAHKPGIVPLRPLQFGDILDGSFKDVRFNPKSIVGLSALVLAAFLVPSALLGTGATYLAARSVERLDSDDQAIAQGFLGVPASVLQMVFTVLATALLSGLLIHVVGQAVLGRKPGLGETWRATRGRLPSLLALTFLSTVFSLLLLAVMIGPGLLLLLNDSPEAGLILLLLGSLGLVVVSLAVSAKISMAAPAIVLEVHGVLAGLRRSFALTKGSAFWRILGITLLAALIAGLVGAVLGLPFSLIGFVIQLASGPGSESGQIAVNFVSHLSALLSGAITTPFVAAVTGLLYIDRRMRLEALDVVLLREAQSNPAPRI